MDLHVCIKIDDDAVDKIARVIVETVKRVAEVHQPAMETAAPVPMQSALASQQPAMPQSAPISQPTVLPQQPIASVKQSHAIPTASHTYTLEELAGAAMLLMDRGMQGQLQELLAGYGVESLPMLPPEQYGSFATALRGMGAQI